MQQSRSTPDRNNPNYWNGNIPWIKTGEINWLPITEAEECITHKGLIESSCKIAEPGILLMAMYGQGITRGRVAILRIKAAYNQACAAIKLSKAVSPEFAILFFHAAYKYIRESGNETSQMNLNAGLIGKIKLPVPPVKEQEGILQNLSATLINVDKLISKTTRSIELLKERRSALITAAVTGQIDLREAA